MRTPLVYVVGLMALALAVGPASARAQGLGLDLSGDTNPQQPPQQDPQGDENPPDTGSLGLDLSGATTGSDLQPRFALVGLDTPERAGAAVARRWVNWLQSVAFKTGQVAKGSDPADAKKQLAADYTNVLRCTQAACFGPAADTLDTDLLTTARLALEDGGWTLRLWTFDRDRGVVETDTVTGRKPTDSAFIKEAGATLAKRVMGLAKPRSILKVSSNVGSAVVRAGQRILGTGNVEAKLPPGDVQLVVEADDYAPFTKTLTLKPGETQEVTARLEFNSASPEGPPSDAVASAKRSSGPSGPSLFTRPALYTAIVGAVLVGVGVAMGSGLKGKVVDANGDGIQDITRSQYLALRQQAMLATGLMAGGGALAAGSVVWLAVVPQRSGPSSTSVAPVSNGASKGSTAVNLVFGGSF